MGLSRAARGTHRLQGMKIHHNHGFESLLLLLLSPPAPPQCLSSRGIPQNELE